MSEEEHTIKILLATDNHLGVWENDDIRCDDSFNTFEEIFSIASRECVDMVLLGGDLFHDNKPSRTTIVKAMDILSRYCLNDRPIALRILSDQSINFTTGRVNYQNPNYNIGLPVFTIHGNHDDPAGGTNLSAVDILATGNLLNYFGKFNIVGEEGHNAGRLRIHPILLQKGDTRLALYGLGNIRDERLCRLFSTPNCVEWSKPRKMTPAGSSSHQQRQTKSGGSLPKPGKRKTRDAAPSSNEEDHEAIHGEDGDEDDWFNIFILHQNRVPHSAAAKNVLREGHLPSFLNIVVWGHEHECIIEPWDTTAPGRSFSIMQPGSSVATALSEGESKRKHVTMLEIQRNRWRTSKFALETVRPFLFDSVTLQGQDGLDPDDPETVKIFLHTKVEGMINKATRSKSVRAPSLPLVRLRVDYTGYSTINTQQFGQRFVGKAANPQDIILWQKKAPPRRPRQGDGVGMALPGQMQTIEEIRIEDLIGKYLQHNLEILSENELTEALHDYVEKEDNKAITVMIDKALKETEKTAMEVGDTAADNDLNEAVALASKKRKEAEDAKKAKEVEAAGAGGASGSRARGGRAARMNDLATELLGDAQFGGEGHDDGFGFDDEDEEDIMEGTGSGSTRQGTVTKRGAATKQSRATASKTAARSTAGKARPTSLKRKDGGGAGLSTIEEEELPSLGGSSAGGRNLRQAATAARKRLTILEEEEEGEEEEGDNDDDNDEESDDDMDTDEHHDRGPMEGDVGKEDGIDDDELEEEEEKGKAKKGGRGKTMSARGKSVRGASRGAVRQKKPGKGGDEDGVVGTADVPISLLDDSDEEEEHHIGSRGGRTQHRGSQHPQRSQFTLGRSSQQPSRGWGGFK